MAEQGLTPNSDLDFYLVGLNEEDKRLIRLHCNDIGQFFIQQHPDAQFAKGSLNNRFCNIQYQGNDLNITGYPYEVMFNFQKGMDALTGEEIYSDQFPDHKILYKAFLDQKLIVGRGMGDYVATYHQALSKGDETEVNLSLSRLTFMLKTVYRPLTEIPACNLSWETAQTFHAYFNDEANTKVIPFVLADGSTHFRNLHTKVQTRLSEKYIKQFGSQGLIEAYLNRLKNEARWVLNCTPSVFAFMNETRERLNAELGDANEEYKKLHEQLIKYNNESIELQKAISTHEGKIKTLERELEDANHALSKLKFLNANLREVNIQDSAERLQSQETAIGLMDELQKQRFKIRELEDKLNRVTEEAAKLKDSAAKLKQNGPQTDWQKKVAVAMVELFTTDNYDLELELHPTRTHADKNLNAAVIYLPKFENKRSAKSYFQRVKGYYKGMKELGEERSSRDLED